MVTTRLQPKALNPTFFARDENTPMNDCASIALNSSSLRELLPLDSNPCPGMGTPVTPLMRDDATDIFYRKRGEKPGCLDLYSMKEVNCGDSYNQRSRGKRDHSTKRGQASLFRVSDGRWPLASTPGAADEQLRCSMQQRTVDVS